MWNNCLKNIMIRAAKYFKRKKVVKPSINANFPDVSGEVEGSGHGRLMDVLME